MAHELQYGRSSSTHQFQSLRACVAAAMTAVAWLQLARHPDLLARAGALLSIVHFTNGQQLQVVCSLRLWSSGHDHVPCSRKSFKRLRPHACPAAIPSSLIQLVSGSQAPPQNKPGRALQGLQGLPISAVHGPVYQTAACYVSYVAGIPGGHRVRHSRMICSRHSGKVRVVCRSASRTGHPICNVVRTTSSTVPFLFSLRNR